MLVHNIPCGTVKVEAQVMFNHLPSHRISTYYKLDGEGNLRISLNALLVIHENRVVLIDPGCADFLPSRLAESYELELPGTFEDTLAGIGYAPFQITDVIFTHLHFDHGSGAFIKVPGKIQMRFPEAKYHVLKEHYQYASSRNPEESNTFFTMFFRYLDQIHWLEDWKEEWMRFLVFYGHTKGMVVPKIRADGREIYYVSDLIPMEIFMESDVSSGYDLDPDLAISEKIEFLKGLETSSEIVFFHDPLKNSLFYP